MNFEYWLYHQFNKVRFNLLNMGQPVDVDISDGVNEHTTLRFGGEVGHQFVAHSLHQERGFISRFSGHASWRVVGEVFEPQDFHAEPLERVSLLCYVSGDEAFVIIGEDAVPMVQREGEAMPITAHFVEGADEGNVVDINRAKRLKMKASGNRYFPWNLPPTPYL